VNLHYCTHYVPIAVLDVVKKLKALNISYTKLDLKAYSEDVHRWYTGKSNERVLRAVKLLHEHGLNFYV